MPQRYFLEVAYNGLNYAGFQVQPNAPTIQSELERALHTVLREKIALTGSSRTDAGVNARQNYFHGNAETDIPEKAIYNINAVLPPDITLRAIRRVKPEAHCRFDAVSRKYGYRIYREKDPFLYRRAYYYPYALSVSRLQQAAAIVLQQNDFEQYAKRHAQVKTNRCTIAESHWVQEGKELVYYVRANRFLRGMVRALAGTMLKLGAGKVELIDFERSFRETRPGLVDFSVPGYGLYLEEVAYPENFFEEI